MKLPDLISTGWTEIRLHKMRSFLSVFAIAIGVATFFYTLSVLSQRYRDIGRAADIAGKGRIDVKVDYPLSLQQYHMLLNALPKGSSVSLETDAETDTISYKNKKLAGFILIGVLPTFQDSTFVYDIEGRFINWKDIENKHLVAVVTVYPREKDEERVHPLYFSSETADIILLSDFSKRVNLLNQQVMIGTLPFTVVGLLHAPPIEKDYRLPEDREYFLEVYLPYPVWYDISSLWRQDFSTRIRVVTGKDSNVRQAASILVSFLRSQFGAEFKPQLKFFQDTLRRYNREAWHGLKTMIFMGIVAMIAGGIGIMNVTMAIIFSRTKEIGIRRALGASRRDILFQFITEALLLGLCGAILGMAIGYISLLYMAEGTGQMTFSWWVVAASILIALTTSFFFALYPAYQAALLKPVNALKYE